MKPKTMNESRVRALIESGLQKIDLRLDGLSVLTEAATGYYMLSPLMAALGGAEQVYALTRDSRFGSATLVRETTLGWARRWGVASKIKILLSRTEASIGLADIVTNLGFVRPLDTTFLHQLKSTAVIPLMWETWEYRPEDLDLAESRRLGIPVLGTNEHHPDLQTFSYIGHIALKLLFSLEVEVFGSRLLVIGSGEFASHTVALLQAAGAAVRQLAPQTEGGLGSETARQMFRWAEVMVVVEHHVRRMLIGPGGDIGADELSALNPGLSLVHLCGGVDQMTIEAAGIPYTPRHLAAPGYMSVTTAEVGPRPLIDLHLAGLKVGQELARAVQAGFRGRQAEKWVLEHCEYAQGFDD